MGQDPHTLIRALSPCGFSCLQPAWAARAAARLAQALREHCREKGLPVLQSLLPSNSAVQSTESDQERVQESGNTVQGRGTGLGWERFGIQDRGSRITGTAGLWWESGPASVEQSSLGKEETKPRLFVSRVIQRQSPQLQIEWCLCSLTRAVY